jgi:hypothetical protein
MLPSPPASRVCAPGLPAEGRGEAGSRCSASRTPEELFQGGVGRGPGGGPDTTDVRSSPIAQRRRPTAHATSASRSCGSEPSSPGARWRWSRARGRGMIVAFSILGQGQQHGTVGSPGAGERTALRLTRPWLPRRHELYLGAPRRPCPSRRCPSRGLARHRPRDGPASSAHRGTEETATAGPIALTLGILARILWSCESRTSFGEATARTQAADPARRETLRIRTGPPDIRADPR